MSEPTDKEVTAANLVTELERLYADLRHADEVIIKRFTQAGIRTWGLDGHILIRMGACLMVAKDLAGIKHKYSQDEVYHVKSNRVLRTENRELREQNEALRTTARTLCCLAGLMETALGSDANPYPVLKEHERQDG